MVFGTWVENALNERDKRGRPTHRIEDLLRQPASGGKRQRPVPKPAASFMSPMLAGMPIRTVKPKPDGTW